MSRRSKATAASQNNDVPSSPASDGKESDSKKPDDTFLEALPSLHGVSAEVGGHKEQERMLLVALTRESGPDSELCESVHMLLTDMADAWLGELTFEAMEEKVRGHIEVEREREERKKREIQERKKKRRRQQKRRAKNA